MSKYNAKKVTYNNLQFDSKFEATYYVYLQELVKQNKIRNLQRQVKYELLPKQYDEHCKFKYHPVIYFSDFEYDDERNVHRVIDTKGFKTPDFRLKQKMFYYKFKTEIECITYKEARKNELFKEADKKMKKYFKCNGE